MKKWKRAAALCLSLCLGGSLVLPCSAHEGGGGDAENGTYVVYLSPEALQLQEADGAADKLDSIPYAEGYYTTDSLDSIQPLLKQGLAEAVPNAPLELLDTTAYADDPKAGKQWHLDFLGASDAWEAGYTGLGVTVAIVDSGVNKGHEDLDQSSLSGCNFLGTEGLRNPAAYDDDVGHGTLAAGTIAAQRGNGLGGAGLTPDASVMSLRSFSYAGGSANAGSGTLSTALSAIGYAIEQKADVINLSVGGTSSVLQEMEPLLERATEAGIILVSSSGNKGTDDLYYPAAFDCVTGVGWVDSEGAVADLSQHNESVFVTAPGVDIFGPDIGAANAYRTNSGSSFATPMVAALAVMAKQADPSIDHEGFEALLRASAQDRGNAGWDEYYGYGVISVSAFVKALVKEYGTPQKPVTESTLSFQTNGGTTVSAVRERTDSVVKLDGFTTHRDGWKFEGWYSDAALTMPVTRVSLKTDKTVYAKWSRELPASEFPFSDVSPSDWFYGDVSYVWQKGLMNGTSKDLFRPALTVNRGMVVTVLHRLAGEPEVSGSCPFGDVQSGSYWEQAILWASRNGIVTGYPDGAFRPNDPVTREQLAAILYRYAGDGSESLPRPMGFPDYDSVSSYAKDGMSWCITNSIINGQKGNLLVPKGQATRGQVAAILHRFCENV